MQSYLIMCLPIHARVYLRRMGNGSGEDCKWSNFDEDSLLYTSSRGTILSTVTHAADGRRLCILICDPTLVSVVASTTEDLPKRAFEYMDTMGWVFIGLAILVTLATDIILVTFISRGILVPLDKLRRATHEIRDGNLDYRSIMREKTSLAMCARILMRCA